MSIILTQDELVAQREKLIKKAQSLCITATVFEATTWRYKQFVKMIGNLL